MLSDKHNDSNVKINKLPDKQQNQTNYNYKSAKCWKAII